MADKKRVTIEILDQKFQIFTDAPPEKIQEIADFLSDHLEKVLAQTKGPFNYKTVMMAALNIAEKYIELSDAHKTMKKAISSRSKKTLKLLDTITST